jgi:HK97 family phage major capsid protein
MIESTNTKVEAAPITDASKGFHDIAEQLRKIADDNIAAKKEMADRVEKDFDKYQKANQELITKIAKLETDKENQEKLNKAFEKFCGTQGSKNISNDNELILNPELNSCFEKLICCSNQEALKSSDPDFFKIWQDTSSGQLPVFGFKKFDPITGKAFDKQQIQQKFLRTDVADAGGLLIAPEISMQIIKRGTEWSPIRQYANVMQTYSNRMQFPVRNVLTASFWQNEAANTTSANSNSNYAEELIAMKRLNVTCTITLEDLMDSPFDMPSLITADVVESFAQKEGAAFISGAGPNQPEGILKSSATIGVTSSKAKLSADDLMEMQKSIKWEIYGQPQYGRTYIMNKRTLITIWELKDGVGRYLWNEGSIANGIPATIRGENYIVAPDMPDIASGAKPIVMGDLKRGYNIVDRMQMYMVRDELTEPGKIKFTFFRRLGAKVVMGEAFVVLTMNT